MRAFHRCDPSGLIGSLAQLSESNHRCAIQHELVRSPHGATSVILRRNSDQIVVGQLQLKSDFVGLLEARRLHKQLQIQCPENMPMNSVVVLPTCWPSTCRLLARRFSLSD